MISYLSTESKEAWNYNLSKERAENKQKVFSKESEETGSWIQVGRLASAWQRRILHSSKSKEFRKPYNEGNDFSQ